jgi:alpha-1,3-rhamnosyltransferase
VIDDGSTDNSFNKILEMKELYSNRFIRFVALRQNNKGLICVLNELIGLSRGDYISLVASDDVLETDAISSEISVLNANPNIMLVTGKNDIIDSNGNVCYWDEQRNNVYEKTKAKWLSFSDYISDTLKINLKGKEFGRYDKLLECNHVPNGYLIRKSVFDLIGSFTSQAPLEDWWLMLQVSKYGELGFIDKTVLKYRWHGTNQMNNIERIMQMEQTTRLYEYQLLANMSDDGKLNFFNKFRHDYIYKALTQSDIIRNELACKKAHVEKLIVSERELQGKVNCQEGHIELLLQSERDLKRLNEALKKENDIYTHTLEQYKIMEDCVEKLRQSVLFKFFCLFNKRFKNLYTHVINTLK